MTQVPLFPKVPGSQGQHSVPMTGVTEGSLLCLKIKGGLLEKLPVMSDGGTPTCHGKLGCGTVGESACHR